MFPKYQNIRQPFEVHFSLKFYASATLNSVPQTGKYSKSG